MYKKLATLGLSFIVSTSALFGIADVITETPQVIEISYERPIISYSEELGAVGLLHVDGTYYVQQNDKIHKVQDAFVDSTLRGMNQEQLLAFWQSGYIVIKKYKDSEDFSLTARTRGLGGGAFGAMWGAIAGKFIVHAIGGAVAGVAGLIVTPIAGPVAGLAVSSGVWGVIAPTVEVTSTAVALAGGIAGGVVTGPV